MNLITSSISPSKAKLGPIVEGLRTQMITDKDDLKSQSSLDRYNHPNGYTANGYSANGHTVINLQEIAMRQEEFERNLSSKLTNPRTENLDLSEVQEKEEGTPIACAGTQTVETSPKSNNNMSIISVNMKCTNETVKKIRDKSKLLDQRFL